jgi:hypothetical protein
MSGQLIGYDRARPHARWSATTQPASRHDVRPADRLRPGQTTCPLVCYDAARRPARPSESAPTGPYVRTAGQLVRRGPTSGPPIRVGTDGALRPDRWSASTTGPDVRPAHPSRQRRGPTSGPLVGYDGARRPDRSVTAGRLRHSPTSRPPIRVGYDGRGSDVRPARRRRLRRRGRPRRRRQMWRGGGGVTAAAAAAIAGVFVSSTGAAGRLRSRQRQCRATVATGGGALPPPPPQRRRRRMPRVGGGGGGIDVALRRRW